MREFTTNDKSVDIWNETKRLITEYNLPKSVMYESWRGVKKTDLLGRLYNVQQTIKRREANKPVASVVAVEELNAANISDQLADSSNIDSAIADLNEWFFSDDSATTDKVETIEQVIETTPNLPVATKTQITSSVEAKTSSVKLEIVLNRKKHEVSDTEHLDFLDKFCFAIGIDCVGDFVLGFETEYTLQAKTSKTGAIVISKNRINTQVTPNDVQGGKMGIKQHVAAKYENAVNESITRVDAIPVSSGLYWQRPYATTTKTASSEILLNGIYSERLDNRLIEYVEWEGYKQVSSKAEGIQKYLISLPTNLSGDALENYIQANSINPKGYNFLGVAFLYQNGKQVFPSQVERKLDVDDKNPSKIKPVKLTGGLTDGWSKPFQSITDFKWYQIQIVNSVVNLHYLPKGNNQERILLGTIGVVENVKSVVSNWVNLTYDKEGQVKYNTAIADYCNGILATVDTKHISDKFPQLTNIKVGEDKITAIVPNEKDNQNNPRKLVIAKKSKQIVSLIYHAYNKAIIRISENVLAEINATVKNWLGRFKASDLKLDYLEPKEDALLIKRCIKTPNGGRNTKLESQAKFVAKLLKAHMQSIKIKDTSIEIGRMITVLTESEVDTLASQLVNNYFELTGKSFGEVVISPKSNDYHSLSNQHNVQNDIQTYTLWATNICKYVYQLTGVEIQFHIGHHLISHVDTNQSEQLIKSIKSLLNTLTTCKSLIKWENLTVGQLLNTLMESDNGKASEKAEMLLIKPVIKANLDMLVRDITKI